jgi:hypothetical protein
MKSDKLWSGKLHFDIPRHREYLGFTQDWPRMNTLPEWYTVEAVKKYAVRDLASDAQTTYTGKQLSEGIPLTLDTGGEKRLVIR